MSVLFMIKPRHMRRDHTAHDRQSDRAASRRNPRSLKKVIKLFVQPSLWRVHGVVKSSKTLSLARQFAIEQELVLTSMKLDMFGKLEPISLIKPRSAARPSVTVDIRPGALSQDAVEVNPGPQSEGTRL